MVRVIDGDTFTTAGPQSVRLFGVDAPERGEQCYTEATERLNELAGDQVRVELGPRAKDRYGRLLYYSYTADGRSIDELLVQEGLAKPWTQDGQHRDHLVGTIRGVKSGGVGCLWKHQPTFPQSLREQLKGQCDPSYPNACIPPDLDCGDISQRRFRVLRPDPHGFDRDRDGIGCES